MSALGDLYAKAYCDGRREYPEGIPPTYRDEVKQHCGECTDKCPRCIPQ